MKLVFVIVSIFAFYKCSSQSESIYGKWKCVATDFRGYQKFTLKQADVVKKSILNIEKNKMYYSEVDFIDLCTFDSIIYKRGLEKEDWSGTSFFYRYSKKDLSEMIACIPVNAKGEWSCYNECAQLYLKQDTMINICGGYTFFLKRVNSIDDKTR